MTGYDIARVRAEFPALAPAAAASPRIHLDNPAGTQVPRRVVDRMVHALVSCNANAHGRFATSVEATAISDEAHRAVADMFNAPSEREVIFGPNMTSLTFDLTRSLGHLFEPGDEVIVTRMDHDANSTPWRIMAREHGLVVKVLDFDRSESTFDLDRFHELVSGRTRLAALNYASNITGTVNDVGAMCARLREVGAVSFVDAVQYAPHGPIDVQALGCDVLVASAYKFYGPHQGVLWAREELLERLRPYKLRVSPEELPHRFETGTYSLEGQAGTLAAVEHLQWIGDTMADTPAEAPGAAEVVAADPGGNALRGGRRRTATVHGGLRAMAAYEATLADRLISGLLELGFTVHGITDPSSPHRRVPTVSVSRDDVDPPQLAEGLAAEGIFVWDGNCYALDLIDHLGLAERGGVVRFGAAHYNTLDEIEQALEAVARLS